MHYLNYKIALQPNNKVQLWHLCLFCVLSNKNVTSFKVYLF